MNDRWTDRLSEYVDGELGVADAAALEAHLPSCGDCRATLEELRRVVTRAGKLDDRPPAADLWPEVATRLGLSPVAQRLGTRAAAAVVHRAPAARGLHRPGAPLGQRCVARAAPARRPDRGNDDGPDAHDDERRQCRHL